MLKVTLTILMGIGFIISIVYLLKQRSNQGITGIKTLLTPICFYLIAMNSLILIWIEMFGLLFWTINIVLLFLAAYFTRYFPKHPKTDGS